jgi:hypothetical protein
MGPRDVATAALTAVPESGAGVAIAAGIAFVAAGGARGTVAPGRGGRKKGAPPPDIGTGWSKSGAAVADGGAWARGASSPWGS